MAGKAKTADRVRTVHIEQATPCPDCGSPTRIVKRVKSRELGIPGGMYLSCSACDFAEKK